MASDRPSAQARRLRGEPAVILVTVGTHHQPFTRLLGALAMLPDDVVVQHGHSRPPSGVGRVVAFLPFPELVELMAVADVVVTHAGVGSILLALRCGHTPVVVPRRRQHSEHVDDHQVELTVALAQRGQVVPVWDVATLADAVDAVPRRRLARAPRQGPLHRAVREALRG